MDVWHSNGDRELARYSIGERDIVLIGIFGPGTPVGQFDRYDLLEAATRRSVAPMIRLYDRPSEDDIVRWLASTELADMPERPSTSPDPAPPACSIQPRYRLA
jgi:hypothetical protein